MSARLRFQGLLRLLRRHRGGVLAVVLSGSVALAGVAIQGGFSSWVHTESSTGAAQGATVELCEADGAAGAECLGELDTPMLEIMPGDSATRGFALRNAGEADLAVLNLEAEVACAAGAGCDEATVAAAASVTIEACTAVTSGSCSGAWVASSLTDVSLDTIAGGSGGAEFAAAGPATGALGLYRMVLSWSSEMPDTLAGSTVDLTWRVIGAVRAGQSGQ